MTWTSSPSAVVCYQLFGFADIQQEVVLLAPVLLGNEVVSSLCVIGPTTELSSVNLRMAFESDMAVQR